jgi:excisionase family DNA binding protein
MSDGADAQGVTMSKQEWQSPRELAERLGVPLRTVYAWRYRGEGPIGTKIGRHVRYRDRDVESWLQRQRDHRLPR